MCKKLGAQSTQAPARLVLDGQCVFRDSGGHSPTGVPPALLAETRGHILPPQLCLHPLPVGAGTAGSMCGYALTVKELVHGPEVQQEYMRVKVQVNSRGIYNGEGCTMSAEQTRFLGLTNNIPIGCKRDYRMHCSNAGNRARCF